MAAAAKVFRGARPGFSSQSQQLIPAIFCRSAQEGVAPLLPRLMHTGSGGSTMLPQQKAISFGGRGVLSQGQKTVRMEQFSSKRSFSSDPEPKVTYSTPWGPMVFAFAIGLALGWPKKRL